MELSLICAEEKGKRWRTPVHKPHPCERSELNNTVGEPTRMPLHIGDPRMQHRVEEPPRGSGKNTLVQPL
jgi:hypothetical protein